MAAEPVIDPCAAVSVVACASYTVIFAVPTPPAKLTDAGYTGAFLFGELEGPVKLITWVPVYPVNVYPDWSKAVI